MDLQTHLQHLRNKRVQIGQSHYDVDANGVIHGIPANDAKHLLSHAHGAWQAVHGKQHAPPAPKRTPFKANFVPKDPTEAPMDAGATAAIDSPLRNVGPYSTETPPPPGAIADPEAIEPTHPDPLVPNPPLADADDAGDVGDDLAPPDALDAPDAATDPAKPKRSRRRR